MAFSVTPEMKNGIAQFTLVGELDAAAAGSFRAAIEQAAASHPKRVVLIMNELSYMASAGLRTLVFAKQKMGTSVDIYVIGVQEAVRETIEMTGFQHSVIMLDTYDAADIENV
jgi:anti-sigma B factor antagonist